jgi:hypothetical protein
MTVEDKMIAISAILKEKEIVKVTGIHEENHKPHQFTISDTHIKASNKNGSGVITEDILEEYDCGHPGCKLKYTEHENDSILFLQLTRDATDIEVHDELKKIKDEIINLKIKSVAFNDTEEGFKFLKE